MKRIVSLVLAVSMVLTAVAGTGDLITKGLARGMDNMVVSPAAIFHQTVLDVKEYSLVGLVTGPVKGVIFGTCRLFAGMADFLTLGLLPEDGNPYSALCVKPIWLEREECTAPACVPCPAK